MICLIRMVRGGECERQSDIQTTARYYLKPDLSVLKDMQKAWQKLILTS